MWRRGNRGTTSAASARVEAGEQVVITVDGRPVAALNPLRNGPRWVSRAAFVARLTGRRADPGLLSQLRELAPDTTDDLAR